MLTFNLELPFFMLAYFFLKTRQIGTPVPDLTVKVRFAVKIKRFNLLKYH